MTNQLRPILNREGKLPSDGWIHIVARGRVPIAVDPDQYPLIGGVSMKNMAGTAKAIMLHQVYDDVGISKILNSFAVEKAKPGFAGMLLDFDHDSEDTTKSSVAAGWIQDMREVPDGIEGRVDFSDLGRDAALGKRFKFASVTHQPFDFEHVGERQFRPTRIDRVAFTNAPRSKQLRAFDPSMLNRDAKSILNAAIGEFFREDGTFVDGVTGAGRYLNEVMGYEADEVSEIFAVLDDRKLLNRAAGVPQPGNETEPVETGEQKGNSGMNHKDMLLKVLGLPATASDQEIQAAVDACGEDTMKNRGEQLAALIEELVENDLKVHAPVIKNRDEMKAALKNNRAGTLKILNSIATPTKALLNRDADAPAITEAAQDAAAQKETDRENYVSQVQTAHSLKNRTDAITLAKTLRPELF